MQASAEEVMAKPEKPDLKDSVADDSPGGAIGTVLRCGRCKKNVAIVHFAAPHGVLSVLKCAGCGAKNDFVNSGQGIVRASFSEG